MLGILYLILCFMLGSVLVGLACPKLARMPKTTYAGKKVSLSQWFVLLPAWFTVGTIVMTWATYGLACCFRNAQEPLKNANMVVLPLAFFLVIAGYYVLLGRKNAAKQKRMDSIHIPEILFIAAVTALAVFLMWFTFFIKDGKIYVGFTVFGDFSPHLGMIRSFSHGNNFPTAYSHFAGEDIRYHFLFQFLAGNLEYLGLRLDLAFNLPSVLSFLFACFLLYALAVKLTGERIVGYLACLFFLFRSSDALFDFLAAVPQGSSALQALKENMEYIGTTPNESWGLWNLNVYCNQRHLAIGICLMLLLIYYFLDDFAAAIKRISGILSEREAENGRGKLLETLSCIGKESLLTKEGWLPKKILPCVFWGVLLGAGSFFNGACVIACLLVLFMIALAADRRLEFLITALITVALSFLESSFFIRGSAVSPQFFFGFIAAVKTGFGVWDFITTAFGILPLVLLAAFLIIRKPHRWVMAAFAAPFFMAFTLSLTPDVTVNHKYILLSVMLLGIFAATFIVWLFRQRGILTKLVSVGLVVSLTATGVYDLTVLVKKNDSKKGYCLVFDEDDPITLWVERNADSRDLFLTPNYSLNNFVMGGAMLYLGWPYYAWSAGYDTDYRAAEVKKMYEASAPEELDALVKEHQIRYIVVDHDARTSPDYAVNEENIRATYQEVYNNADTAGYGEWMVSIFDTTLRVQN